MWTQESQGLSTNLNLSFGFFLATFGMFCCLPHVWPSPPSYTLTDLELHSWPAPLQRNLFLPLLSQPTHHPHPIPTPHLGEGANVLKLHFHVFMLMRGNNYLDRSLNALKKEVVGFMVCMLMAVGCFGFQKADIM